MTRRLLVHFSLAVTLAVVAGGCSGGSEPKSAADASTLFALATNVDAARGAAGTFRPGRSGDRLNPGDRVRTDATGHAELDWRDGSLTRLGPSTTVRISPLAKPERNQVKLRLDVGETWHRVERVTGSGRYDVETPVGVASVRGTRFAVLCSAARECAFKVVEGTITVTPTGASPVVLTAGQTLALSGSAGAGTPQTVGVDALSADPFIARNQRLDATPRSQRTGALSNATTTSAGPTSPTPAPASPAAARSSAVAFSRGGGIFVLRSDGRTRQLTSSGETVRDYFPAVSPDGTQIAFTRNAGGNKTVVVMQADGSRQRAIATGLDGPFAWSPDGRRIAGRQGDFSIGIVATTGGAIQTVPNTYLLTEGASWSPDGSSFVFHGETEPETLRGLYVIRADGSGRRSLPGDTGYANLEPAWSPTGREVAFIGAQPSGGRTGLWIVNADGATPAREIVHDRMDCTFRQPAWTSDARFLVAHGQGCLEPKTPEEQSPGVWLVDVANGRATRLANAEDFPSVAGPGPFAPER